MSLESAIEVCAYYMASCEQELHPDEYRMVTSAIN